MALVVANLDIANDIVLHGFESYRAEDIYTWSMRLASTLYLRCMGQFRFQFHVSSRNKGTIRGKQHTK
jgi:hypothetical protein